MPSIGSSRSTVLSTASPYTTIPRYAHPQSQRWQADVIRSVTDWISASGSFAPRVLTGIRNLM
jgi:hypothetical protein